MSIIKIVRRNIMFKPLQSLVACCVVMASIAMAVLVLLLADGVHSGLTAAAEPFPIVAGQQGEPKPAGAEYGVFKRHTHEQHQLYRSGKAPRQ